MKPRFKAIKNVDPQNPGTIEYIARAVRNGTVDIDKLIHELEMMSTLNGADIKGVLYGLNDRLVFHLSRGYSVSLGTMGSFRVTVRSTRMPTEAEVDETAITKKRLVFTPGKRIRRMLDTMEFRKMKA